MGILNALKKSFFILLGTALLGYLPQAIASIYDIRPTQSHDSRSYIAATVKNGFAYTATDSQYFEVFDVRDPSNIKFVGSHFSCFDYNIVEINVVDSQLLVVCEDYISVFNLNEPATPVLEVAEEVTNYPIRDAVYDNENNLVFAASGDSDFVVYDLDLPENARELTRLSGQTFANVNLRQSNNVIYFAESNGNIGLIDVSNLSVLSKVVVSNPLAESTQYLDALIVGDYLYVATNQGLHIYDFADPDSPVYLTKIELLNNGDAIGQLSQLELISDKLMGFNLQGVVTQFDLTSPASPEPVNVQNYTDNSILKLGFDVTNSIAIFASQQGLQLFDISDLANFEHINTYGLALDSKYVTINNGTIIIVEEDSSLNSLTVDEEGNFNLLATFAGENYSNSIVKDGFAWIGQLGSLKLIDLENPGNPIVTQLIDTVEPNSQIKKLMEYDGKVYVSLESGKLHVFSPNGKILTSDFVIDFSLLNLNPGSFVSDLVKIEDTLFATTNNDSLVAIDISEPANPEVIFIDDGSDSRNRTIELLSNAVVVTEVGYENYLRIYDSNEILTNSDANNVEVHLWSMEYDEEEEFAMSFVKIDEQYGVVSTRWRGLVLLNFATVYPEIVLHESEFSLPIIYSDSTNIVGFSDNGSYGHVLVIDVDENIEANYQYQLNEDTKLTETPELIEDTPSIFDIKIIAMPENGDLTVNNIGEFNYFPNDNFFGSDSFYLSVQEPDKVPLYIRINLTVEPTNDAPIAENSSITMFKGETKNGQVVASDVDGDNLSYTITRSPVSGDFRLNADGSFRFRSNNQFVGDDFVLIDVADPDGEVASVRITLKVMEQSSASGGGTISWGLLTLMLLIQVFARTKNSNTQFGKN